MKVGRSKSKDAKAKIVGRLEDYAPINEDLVVVADRVRWPGLGGGPEHDQHAVPLRLIGGWLTPPLSILSLS